jgi:hypothetical protein
VLPVVSVEPCDGLLAPGSQRFRAPDAATLRHAVSKVLRVSKSLSGQNPKALKCKASPGAPHPAGGSARPGVLFSKPSELSCLRNPGGHSGSITWDCCVPLLAWMAACMHAPHGHEHAET